MHRPRIAFPPPPAQGFFNASGGGLASEERDLGPPTNFCDVDHCLRAAVILLAPGGLDKHLILQMLAGVGTCQREFGF
jgi:hypothetical protein